MDKDLARTHSLSHYPIHTPETAFVIDSRPASSLTHYTVAYIHIGGTRNKILFYLMKTKPWLEIVLRSGWLL